MTTVTARWHRLTRRASPFTPTSRPPAMSTTATATAANLTPAPPAHPPWTANILSAQRHLLDYHTVAHPLTLQELRIPLPNSASINVVVARPHIAPSTSRVLLLLHGWGAGLAFFSRTLPYITPHFSAVYMADLPGMGASSRARHDPAASVPTALSYFVQDLSALYATLATHHALFRDATARHLAAHSLGAYVAVEWLLQSSTLFDGLVLISPVGVPHPPPPPTSPPFRGIATTTAIRALTWLWSRGVTPQDALRALPSGIARRLCRRYVEARYSAALSPRDHALMTEYCLHLSLAPPGGERAVASLLLPGAWAKVPLIDRLPALQGPVAFLYGDRDWMDWRAGEAVRQTMRGPTSLFRIADADHNVFVDNAKGFAHACVDACRAAEGIEGR